MRDLKVLLIVSGMTLSALTACGGSSSDPAAASSSPTPAQTESGLDGKYNVSAYGCDGQGIIDEISTGDDPRNHRLVISGGSMKLYTEASVCGLAEADLVMTESYALTDTASTFTVAPLYLYDYLSTADCSEGGEQTYVNPSAISMPFTLVGKVLTVTWPRGNWGACSQTITFTYIRS